MHAVVVCHRRKCELIFLPNHLLDFLYFQAIISECMDVTAT